MAPTLADPHRFDHDGDDYDEEADSDFAPEEHQGASSDDENGAPAEGCAEKQKPVETVGDKKRKQLAAAGDGHGHGVGVDGLDNSGDEAVIQKGQKIRKKHEKKRNGEWDGDANEDERGEGGLIKTRSMRANEKAERRAAKALGPVTVDVDALWAQMISGPVFPANDGQTNSVYSVGGDRRRLNNEAAQPQPQGRDAPESAQSGAATKPMSSETSTKIRIKRTYNFAGKIHTEEKIVTRDSAEARLVIQGGGECEYLGDDTAADDAKAVQGDGEQREEQKYVARPAFRSRFEPIAQDSSLSQRADLDLNLTRRMRAREEAAARRVKKVNVVEKSRMDWAGFVDKEGIENELVLAGKAKGSFNARAAFLARSEVRREEGRKAMMGAV